MLKAKRDAQRKKARAAAALLSEEASRKAAEEEAEKERQRLAEEAKVAALKLAEEKSKQQKSNTHIVLKTEDDRRRDLMAWLRSIPLSESCFDRIDRAFSSGVLVAEVIHHFCPAMCDKRFYFKWHSSSNKLSNWDNLNRKVFPLLGFRLHQRQICNILNPFSCGKHETNCEKGFFIYKLLYRIRDKLAEVNPSVYDYRSPSFVRPQHCKAQREQLPPKKEFRNMLDYPCYSKIEILIANGYYDDKETDKELPEKETSSSCRRCSSCATGNVDTQRITVTQMAYNDMTQSLPQCHSSNFDITRSWSWNGTEVCVPMTTDVQGQLLQATTTTNCCSF